MRSDKVVSEVMQDSKGSLVSPVESLHGPLFDQAACNCSCSFHVVTLDLLSRLGYSRLGFSRLWNSRLCYSRVCYFGLCQNHTTTTTTKTTQTLIKASWIPKTNPIHIDCATQDCATLDCATLYLDCATLDCATLNSATLDCVTGEAGGRRLCANLSYTGPGDQSRADQRVVTGEERCHTAAPHHPAHTPPIRSNEQDLSFFKIHSFHWNIKTF